ncbi:hypothetical protein EC604_01340 [Paenibacillus amylolyticus]|jgi:hypothetical protein|uniref:Uncharacterized protein n=1 Tax=Paenibacillus amylolyticus TaxID=1451 RepID=A0A5M9WLQ1_PAEAM|nr:hypothetical protein [Paenibacillus amylolyticus]KAA8782492.1 hypothetical protein EC604_01340 [Paenibacillus amylolyticus]
MNLIIVLAAYLILISLPIIAVILAFRLRKKKIQFEREQRQRMLEFEIKLKQDYPETSPELLPETRKVLKKAELYQQMIAPFDERIAKIIEKVEYGSQKGRIYLHGDVSRWDKSGYFESDRGTKHFFKFRKGAPKGDAIIQELEPLLIDILELMDEREGKLMEFALESRKINTSSY